MKHASFIIYGKIPRGEDKVKTYCLRRGGYWFMNRAEIMQAKKDGFKLIIKGGEAFLSPTRLLPFKHSALV